MKGLCCTPANINYSCTQTVKLTLVDLAARMSNFSQSTSTLSAMCQNELNVLAYPPQLLQSMQLPIHTVKATRTIQQPLPVSTACLQWQHANFLCCPA
jgi:hypothetical protein